MSDLIDTTEMYLRTIYELEEEGIVPLRARIAERLGHPARRCRRPWPGWSATACCTSSGDRHLELTDERPSEGGPGDAQAPPRRAAAGRRDRPGVGVRPRGGLPLGARDERAGRAKLLADARPARRSRRTATRSPAWRSSAAPRSARSSWTASSRSRRPRARRRAASSVRRISEEMQKDEVLMSAMRRVGALPDKTVTVVATSEGVLVGSGGETAEIVPEAADHIFVRKL